MSEDPLPDAGATPSGDSEPVSRPPKLRFDGLGPRNGAVSEEESLERDPPPDPRVQALAGARYKSMSPARLPISRTPSLTIPSGFSPSALLESPVLLTNIKAEPSPTTGTFAMSKHPVSAASPQEKSNNNLYGENNSGNFEFRPNIRSGLSSLAPLASSSSKTLESETFAQAQNQSLMQPLSCSQLLKSENTGFFSHDLTLTTVDPPVETVAAKTNISDEVASCDLQETRGPENGVIALQPDNNRLTSSAVAEKSSDDGYNWRKYGQKHVKGSEFPRSYYKCTHPNCHVKKQLERSHDGHIAEIIYKGCHDHPKPQPSRRLAIGAIFSSQGEEKSDGVSSFVNGEEKSSNPHGQVSHNIDPNDNAEQSPVSVSDDGEGGGDRLNYIGDEGADGDDPESKRRKKDASIIDATQISKANREPRVVVQTVSEVDILDDGYKWRKYGQKVVKGNPNPRSYYKCTNVGCPVRKHVERASHDPKAVITTYEGKHNHDVPVSRNSSHDLAAPVVGDGANILNSHMTVALNGMLRACDMQVLTQRQTQYEGDNVSLDLGVGIRPRHRSSDEQQQEQAQNHCLQFPGSKHNKMVPQATPFSILYRGPSHNLYGSKEDKGDSFTFNAPGINHAPNSYYSHSGNLVMGP